jgi:hypothetical protein
VPETCYRAQYLEIFIEGLKQVGEMAKLEAS